MGDRKPEVSLDSIVADFTAQVCENRAVRWEKALEAAESAGELKANDSDIGFIARRCAAEANSEIQADLIMALYEAGWPKIRRTLLAGIDSWYKAKLKPVEPMPSFLPKVDEVVPVPATEDSNGNQ